MRLKYLLIIFCIITLGFLGYYFYFSHEKYSEVPDGFSYETRNLEIGGFPIEAYIADTGEKIERGLGGFQALDKNHGMLFVLKSEGLYPFWMKGMLFPIDIIWINNDLKVVYIKQNADPASYPEVFYPDTPASYVLEVPAGTSFRHNFKIGTPMRFFAE